MASIWDAAKTLLAMAGGDAAAVAAAHDVAAECARSRRHAEAAFWRAVADAVIWEANPQPLIAPDLGPSHSRAGPRGASPEGRSSRERSLELPQHRGNVLRFRRDLREIWKRYGGEDDATARPPETPQKDSDC
jgi:hypothetical protein